MFKYTSPWQVLCSSLEKREQISVNGEEGSSSFPDISADYTNHDATDSTHTIVKISTQYQTIDSSDADSGDLIDINEDIPNPYKIVELVSAVEIERESDVPTKYLHADEEITNNSEEQSLNITDTEVNTATSDENMDRVTRSLIFSLSSSRSIDGSREDLTNSTQEEIQEADKRKDVDVSIPSPDRNVKLKVLREEKQFEIRSHRPEISPSKLFVDSDDESGGYSNVRSHQFTPEKVWELEQERRDIIKKQGQRKSLDAENLINFQDSTDSPSKDKEVNGGQNAADIDIEQINFEAARQQFVMLEKKRNSLPITPRLQHRPPRLSSQSLYENYSYREPTILEQEVFKNESTVSQESSGRERSASLLRKQFLRDFSVDNEKEEKSGDTYKGETSVVESEEQCNIPNPSDETPIEREIRLAMQREENLRKERGILHSVESTELVEIQKNPVLSISPDTQLSKKNKDRARTAFFLQKEIEKEAQREADLKTEGKVAGLYDKGNAQELDERRKVFEQPDEIPVHLKKITTKTSTKGSITDTQENTNQRDSELGNEGNEATNLTVVDAPLPYSVRTNWKPTPLNPYRTRRLSMDNILDVRVPNETTTAQETSVESVVHKVNFQIKPLKFGLQGDQAEDYKVEKTPVSVNGVEIYNRRLKPSRSFMIEEEIRKNIERDQELQEQRRKSELTPVATSKEDHFENNNYRKPSVTSDGSRTWSPSSRKNIPLMFTPRSYPKVVFSESESDSLKKPENWYAGIDPSDSVNTEIVESTRVSRHKSKMALRWEAGLFANEPSE